MYNTYGVGKRVLGNMDDEKPIEANSTVEIKVFYRILILRLT